MWVWPSASLLVSRHPGPPASRCCLPDPSEGTPEESMYLPWSFQNPGACAMPGLKIYQVNKNTVESQCLAWGLKIIVYYWNDLGAFQLTDNGLTDCGMDTLFKSSLVALSLLLLIPPPDSFGCLHSPASPFTSGTWSLCPLHYGGGFPLSLGEIRLPFLGQGCTRNHTKLPVLLATFVLQRGQCHILQFHTSGGKWPALLRFREGMATTQ